MSEQLGKIGSLKGKSLRQELKPLEERIFNVEIVPTSRWITLTKRALLAIATAHLLIGLISTYRAYYQIHSLAVTAGDIVQPGSTIKTEVVTYGRSFADVRLELIQHGKAQMLHEQHVAANEFGFYDPRTQTASFSVVITPQMLERFEAGSAVLRATAVGREQWTRLPPPVVREVNVTIRQ